jgi:hypothetical protein
LSPTSLQGRCDQGGEPMRPGQLHTLADHAIETPPEDQLRLEMSLGHGGDLAGQDVLGSTVETTVAVKPQDEAFMPLSRADRIVSRGERRWEVELVSCMVDVAGVIVFGSEESLGHTEVGAADQEADLVGGLAPGLGHVEQTGRQLEGAGALGRVEDQRRLVDLPFGGIEDDHSRHKTGSRLDVASRLSLATNTSLS